jgi:hypothetical protein
VGLGGLLKHWAEIVCREKFQWELENQGPVWSVTAQATCIFSLSSSLSSALGS